MVNSAEYEPESAAESVEQEEYIPSYEQEQTVLIIGCEWRGGAGEYFSIVKLDPVKRELVIADIPPQTAATVSSRTDTIAGHYDYGGCQMAVQAVENACEIEINRYIRLEDSAAEKLVDLCGGIEYGVSLREAELSGLTAGEQTLDFSRIKKLALAREAGGERSNFISGMLSSLINESMKKILLLDSEDLYKFLTDNTDTNISAYDFNFRKKAIEYTAAARKIASTVRIDGDFEDDEFLLSQQTVTLIASRFAQASQIKQFTSSN